MMVWFYVVFFFFFQAEDGIRDHCVTGVQTCALPISSIVSVGATFGNVLMIEKPRCLFTLARCTVCTTWWLSGLSVISPSGDVNVRPLSSALVTASRSSDPAFFTAMAQRCQPFQTVQAESVM